MVMILFMAIFDTMGIVSIMPFIAVLSNPDIVETNRYLSWIYDAFNFSSVSDFNFALGVAVFVFLVFSLAFKALTTFVHLRFTMMREFTIGSRLMVGYLHQPYKFFLKNNSADLGKTILSEVSIVIGNGFLPFITLISYGVVSLFLLTVLLVVDYVLAIFIGGTLACSYFITFRIVNKYTRSIGEKRVKANELKYTSIAEAFGAAKEIKVGGLENIYAERFASPAKDLATFTASASIVGQLPRYILEAIAFGGMIVVILYLIFQKGSFDHALPIIVLYALAGYRLLPALQQVYASLTQLSFAGPAINSLHDSYKALDFELNNTPSNPITFNKEIRFEDICFSYEDATRSAVSGINLSIKKNTIVGLVGATGSGKTTFVDLVLGLLEPQRGCIFVDGVPLDQSRMNTWRTLFGYVPQQIYLSDDSLEANIALGVHADELDKSAVLRAAKIANLHDFVANELPQAYETIIGERGVRLSGGQRQRIGIARALYHNPKILILDEATSALDNLTERFVMDSIEKLNQEVTIILIAHRLSTVQKCDKIFLFDKGLLLGEGRYDELLSSNNLFKKLAVY